MIRRIVTTYVLTELNGVEIITAASVREALELLDQEGFDLVMCPRSLPDGDGPDLLRRMRGQERHAQTPVILMTPAHDPLPEEECRSLGVARVLPLPFDAGQLREAVQTVLDPRRQRRDMRIGLEGAVVHMTWEGRRLSGRIINLGSGGLLCQVEDAPGRRFPLEPVELSLQFPPRLGGGRAQGIQAGLLRLNVLTRGDDHIPRGLRLAWEFLRLPQAAVRVLEGVLSQARRDLEQDRRRATGVSPAGGLE